MVFVFSLLLAGTAHAQNNAVNFVQDSVRPFVAEQREGFQQERMELQKNRQNIVDQAQANRAETAETRVMLREEAQEAKAQLQEDLANAETEEERQAILDAAKEEHQEAREELRSEVDANRADIRSQVSTQLTDRIDLVFRKFNAYMERGENILGRIDSRLDEMEAAGADTSSAQKLFDQANDQLNASQAHLDDATGYADQIDTESMEREEIKELLASMKEELKEAREDIKAAYASIRETVAEIKPHGTIDA